MRMVISTGYVLSSMENGVSKLDKAISGRKTEWAQIHNSWPPLCVFIKVTKNWTWRKPKNLKWWFSVWSWFFRLNSVFAILNATCTVFILSGWKHGKTLRFTSLAQRRWRPTEKQTFCVFSVTLDSRREPNIFLTAILAPPWTPWISSIREYLIWLFAKNSRIRNLTGAHPWYDIQYLRSLFWLD